MTVFVYCITHKYMDIVLSSEILNVCSSALNHWTALFGCKWDIWYKILVVFLFSMRVAIDRNLLTYMFSLWCLWKSVPKGFWKSSCHAILSCHVLNINRVSLERKMTIVVIVLTSTIQLDQLFLLLQDSFLSWTQVYNPVLVIWDFRPNR